MVRWVIVISAASLFLLRFHLVKEKQLPYSEGDKIKITSTIYREPIKIYQKRYIVIEGIVVEVPEEFDLGYGDRVAVSGTISDQVPEVNNAKFGLINESFDQLQDSTSLPVRLYNLRQLLIARIMRWLPANEGALAAGILLGGTEGMSYTLAQSYRRSGMTHVVAASGYNVTVVAGWTIIFFARLVSRRLAILLGIVSIVIYVFLAGASAAVVRAGIMAVAAWVGQLLGREGESLWGLGVASWLMLMFDPNYLVDIGFQLSVAATAGILWFKPSKEIWASLAAQVTTLPLILHHFGNLSVVAPIANLLLLWLVPPIMQIVAVGVVVGPVNLLAWPLLKVMNEGVIWLGSFSWSSWSVGQVAWWWVIVYYLTLLTVSKIWLPRYRK